ncbi:hypothetical protein [[Mycobacterium] nativiensis]|uniref:Uncharacterized protein n=1 Tax=[Mycobacterium] nativiensis TaxID=2855503 RepID=A0ABU5XRJ6_9MYCO|nr:hypothetical protein [Mycolicibacter sp. MYC340]MEB3030601.1 hypothetical protein [Mycolicibacter sp. MYC340]
MRSMVGMTGATGATLGIRLLVDEDGRERLTLAQLSNRMPQV